MVIIYRLHALYDLSCAHNVGLSAFVSMAELRAENRNQLCKRREEMAPVRELVVVVAEFQRRCHVSGCNHKQSRDTPPIALCWGACRCSHSSGGMNGSSVEWNCTIHPAFSRILDQDQGFSAPRG